MATKAEEIKSQLLERKQSMILFFVAVAGAVPFHFLQEFMQLNVNAGCYQLPTCAAELPNMATNCPSIGTGRYLCDANGDLTRLDWPMNITGSISSLIGLFTSLTYIGISQAKLSGT